MLRSQLEKKLFSLFKECGELEFPDEDWVFQVLPDLNYLETDTLDSLLEQALTHSKYERAARELLQREKIRMEQEHATKLHALKSEAENDTERQSMGAELRLQRADELAREERKELEEEATERIEKLENTIEELEETIARKDMRMKEMEAEAEAECERLRDEGLEAMRGLRDAQEETDLKRETSRKLKEEIIDNDRLTVANLNRIKSLEALVDQHKAALDEAENENEGLRTELEKTIGQAADNHAQAEENETLRDLLTEREAQIMSLSRRLSEAIDGGENYPRGVRRDSFFDQFRGINPLGPKSLASGA